MRKKICNTVMILITALVLAVSGCAYEPATMGPSAYEYVVVIGIDGGGGLFNNGDSLIPEFEAFFSTSDSMIG